MKRYAWLALVALVGCGPVNNEARNAEDFTVVRTGANSLIVRIDPNTTRGPQYAHCYAIHMEPFEGGYIARSARLPKGVCE